MSHENFQPYLVLSPTQTKGPRIDAHALAGEDGKYNMSRREEKHMETHTKFATNPYPSIYTGQWAYLTDTVVCITAS